MSKNSQHIAVVCNYILTPNRIGGMDRFFVAYDSAAKERGFEISWFFSDYQTFEFYNELNIYSAEGKMNVELYFLWHIKQTPNKFTILVTHFTSLCGSFYKKVKENTSIQKTFVVDHNPRPLNGFPLKKQLKNRIKGWTYHKYIDQFIGVSKYTVDHIIKDLGPQVQKKTKCIYNGIDTSVIKFKSPVKDRDEKPIRFVVVSHLRYSKGIQDLLEAIGKLPESELKKMTIAIYGEGPMKELLMQQMRDFNLNEVISFKGSSSKINDLLYQYDYMLQPTHMECFSLSILESLAANVPVITTPVGGNPEIIKDGENGFLFQARNIQQLKSILSEIINDKKGIDDESRELIESEFNLEEMVNNHIKLLD